MTGIRIARTALVVFQNNDPLRMAGATAFFTMFALPPILIILIQIFGLVVNPEELTHHIFQSLAVTLGKPSVHQIHITLQGFQRLARNWYLAAGGFVFLLFVATTLFKVIKDSVNQLWAIHLREGRWTEIFLPRLRSFSIILLAGFLFLSGLASEAILVLLRNNVNELLPGLGSVLFFLLRQAMSLLVVTVWFAVLFKYLPDGSFSWKITVTGALFTGVLFTVGKILLGSLLAASNFNSIYGASGSVVIVLLFLFYVSLIFYFGASFTKAWADYKESPVHPGKHADLLK